MRERFPVRAATACVAFCSLFALPTSAAQGHGDYFNVETPVVKALAIARLAGHDFLLVCNPPDNSVEIWDTTETTLGRPSFRARVPVGLEPCSLRWNPHKNIFYTADFLGDSVTAVLLTAPSGAGSLTWSFVERRNVGTSPNDTPGVAQPTRVDEPMDIALLEEGSKIAVTSHTGSSVHYLDAVTLQPTTLGATTQEILVHGTQGVKEPRRIERLGNRLVVQAFKGGTTLAAGLPGALAHDVDLFIYDPLSGVKTLIGGMGTTNAGMAVTSGGTIYAVGGHARIDLPDGNAVRAALTGFVTSEVYVVRPGSTTALSRDLNAVPNTNPTTAFPHGEALAAPADIVAYPVTAGTKLFIAAMSSDRIGVVVDNGTDNLASWSRSKIDLIGGSSTGMHGPRSLALRTASGQKNDPGNRLYSFNRVSQSISVFDPDTDTCLATLPLNQDPTPTYIHEGRRFLYDARMSRNGFVSCSSCHPDGRTDGLAWDLGHNTAYVDTFTRDFVDSPNTLPSSSTERLIAYGFVRAKGRITTQSLQGLVNFEASGDLRDRVTNAPYHWRGDRKDFLSFNDAFVSLLGRNDLNIHLTGGIYAPPADRPDLPMGISNNDMVKFETFIQSVQYPPNPRQNLGRRYSGTVGADVHDFTVATGAMSGLIQFHVLKIPGLGNRSCVHCHQLPEGSNNLFTFAEGAQKPLESAALRGLLQKERVISNSDGTSRTEVLTNFGVLVTGNSNDVNDFEGRFDDIAGNPSSDDLRKRFLHELDWSVGPMVGQVESVGTTRTALQTLRIDAMEAAVTEANASLVVHVHTNSTAARGFRFVPGSSRYEPEPNAGPSLTRNDVLMLLASASDRAVFQCTALGSERRIANPSGVTSATTPSPITGARLVGMVTNTANTLIPSLTQNWVPTSFGGDFHWSLTSYATPPSLKKIRQLQWVQIHYANGAFGLGSFRHDAPRRFRVAAWGLQPGCKLILGVDPSAMPTPTSPATLATHSLEIPLYGTGMNINGLPVWESAIELDLHEYLVLLAGGRFAPGVATILDASLTNERPTAQALFAPTAWNLHHVALQNPGGAVQSFGWLPLRLEP